MNGTNNKSKGKVYICGAGPGNPDLITKKCWDLLKHCDIILYDRLVGKGILELIPENTPKIYVGRAAGDPTSNQLKTNQVMLQDRKSTRLNSSHANISYAVFCLKKKKIIS